MSCCPQTRNTLKTRIRHQENTQPIPRRSITRLPAASLSTVTTSSFASEVEGAASSWLPGSLVRPEPTSAPSSSYPIYQWPLPKLPSLPRTRCTFSNRHLHTSYNRLKTRRSNRRHLFTFTIGCLRHRNRRSTQAAIYQRRPQVNTKPRPPPHTNLVNVRRLMRLTVSTSAPPRSGRPKALTQRLHLLHRHTSPTHRRPSHMYRRHRHQHLDHEDMHEPVQMYLQEVQRVQ